MKPPPFEYHGPTTVAETLDVLAETHAKVLAGGQSLLPILNMRLAEPAHIVDINRLTDLAYIRVTGQEVIIGALARDTGVEHDAAAAERLPVLREALRLVAHPVIRNRGTVVGSLVHADPAAELPAVAMLLEGSIELTRRGGARIVKASEFFRGPLDSAIEPDELAVAAHFPVPSGRVGTDVAEVSRRHGDYALAGVATLVTLNGGAHARVACFGVGPTPIVVETDAEPAEVANAAAAAVRETVDPEDDIHATADYRRHLAGVLTARSVGKALARAQGGVA